MNIKTIKTEKFEGLAVLVPDDAHSFNIQDNPVEGGKLVAMLRGIPDYACVFSPNLPHGQFEILGKAAELTEEECAEIVEIKLGGFKNYNRQSTSAKDFNWDFFTKNAKESFGSLMESIGCYSVNPFGEKPAETFNHPDWEFTRAKWQEAQANTGTWIILRKI